MSTRTRPHNLVTLNELLPLAERGGYAIGSFAPRYTTMIGTVLRAAQRLRSPLIVQISNNEFRWYESSPAQFAEEFYRALRDEQITVPVVLHLDHTKVMDVIETAIGAGFTSVMMDASEKPLDENIALSKEAVSYAHAHGASAEAELGMIGTTDMIETDRDEELFTDPEEAERFVRETGVDALAVSVGTAHGVYMVRQPRVDYDRLAAIKARTGAHMVLHGGSGVPADMMARAIKLPGGGVSKINIATDLEQAFLQAIGRAKRMTDAECRALPPEQLAAGSTAVERTVSDKISNFVLSEGRAGDFRL
ncbi:MAG: class II fructose-bisphosphate aldolase [Chloroflexota bacterium]